MPNPVGLNTTTIHAKYVEPNSTATPLQGTVTFTPNPAVITFPTENVVVAGTETATLDVNGEFVIELISTDQAGENPTGWTYTVTEKLIGQKQRTYNIELPYNNGTTVELADITPTDAAPTYIPVVGPVGSPGLITSVNGYSAASITLTATDVGAVPTTAEGVANGVATLNASGVIPLAQYDGASVVLISTLGVANGVATLDAGTKIPVAQIPDISTTYVPWSNVEVANGVASLDASAKIKSTELNLAASAPPSVGTSAVGTSTNLARQDHSHDGVDLVNAQSIAGAKNFTTSVQTAQLGVGVAPGGSRVAVQSAADEIMLLLVNTVNAPNSSAIRAVMNQGTDNILAGRVTGDTNSRLLVNASGSMSWGPGNAASDVTLSRSAAGTLNFAGTRLNLASGGRMVLNAAAGATLLLSTFVTADTQDRFELDSNGTMSWSAGSGSMDTNLYRASAGLLKTDSSLTVVGNFTVVGVGQELYVRKTANQTVANSTTYIADNDLTLNLSANATYVFELFLVYEALSGAGINVRMSYSGASSSSRYSPDILQGETSGSTGNIRRDVASVGTGFGVAGGAGAGSAILAKFSGIINTTTAGALFFEWSQNVSNATATQVDANSYLKVRRIA